MTYFKDENTEHEFISNAFRDMMSYYIDNEYINGLINDIQNEHYYHNRYTLPDKYWNEIGEMFFGVCVMIWGDYGTSPRCGWIKNNNWKFAKEFLKSFINEYEDKGV